MINLGFGYFCAQTKFQNQLISFLEKIHFKYGRIQGIFKDYRSGMGQNPSMYPIPELDSIFDFFTRIRLLPHIDFAFISRDTVFSRNTGHPRLIRFFLNHFKQRYGKEALSSWRFEYSMPVNDSGKPLLDSEEYADNCAVIGNIIKDILPDAPVGYFASSPLFPRDFSIKILQKISGLSPAPDYLSIHLFPYEIIEKDGTWQPMLSSDQNFFNNYVREFKELCRQNGLGNLPVFVTHLQNEYGKETWLNDSAFMAPFLFKTYTGLYTQAENISYCAFSDLICESGGSNPYFFGGSGAISQHGVKKSSYFALFMLSRTPDKIFYSSDNCFITSKDDRSCQILMHNYVHYSAAHCLDSRHPYPADQVSAQLEPGSPLEFILDFSQWPPGYYRLQKFCLGPKKGSALEEYLRMNIRDSMLPIELDYLQRCSDLDICVQYIDIGSTTVLRQSVAPSKICVYVLNILPSKSS